jgi:hypothetical protein
LRKPFITEHSRESTRHPAHDHDEVRSTHLEPARVLKKGDRVRLLQPIFDGTQLRPRDTVIAWPFDDAPTGDMAELALPEPEAKP